MTHTHTGCLKTITRVKRVTRLDSVYAGSVAGGSASVSSWFGRDWVSVQTLAEAVPFKMSVKYLGVHLDRTVISAAAVRPSRIEHWRAAPPPIRPYPSVLKRRCSVQDRLLRQWSVKSHLDSVLTQFTQPGLPADHWLLRRLQRVQNWKRSTPRDEKTETLTVQHSSWNSSCTVHKSPLGNGEGTVLAAAAVHGLSSLFRTVSAVEPSLCSPLPTVPVPNRPSRLRGRKATHDESSPYLHTLGFHPVPNKPYGFCEH